MCSACHSVMVTVMQGGDPGSGIIGVFFGSVALFASWTFFKERDEATPTWKRWSYGTALAFAGLSIILLGF